MRREEVNIGDLLTNEAIADQTGNSNARRVRTICDDGCYMTTIKPEGIAKFYAWDVIERWWRKCQH